MADIEAYLRIVFFNHFDTSGTSVGAYVRRTDLEKQIEGIANDIFSKYSEHLRINLIKFSSDMFDELASNGVILTENDDFAGTYFNLIKVKYDTYRQLVLNESPIYARANRIGGRFFEDVLRNFEQTNDAADGFPDWGIEIPAADRIVSINHNSPEIGELRGSLDTLAEAVRVDNSEITGDPSERSRFVQQIKAAADLLRIDRVSVRSISALIVPVLRYLAKTFAKGAIGLLAEEILKLLAAQFGLAL